MLAVYRQNQQYSGDIAAPDLLLQNLVSDILIKAKKKKDKEEREKLELAQSLVITETAKQRKKGTISLGQLIGKEAALQVNDFDSFGMAISIQKIKKKQKQRQDDEFILMM